MFCESSSAGRASRCQREGRRFESVLSLKGLYFEAFFWRRSQVVRQRSAKPPLTSSNLVDASMIRRGGEIGRHKGLKIPRTFMFVPGRFRPSVQICYLLIILVI